MSIQIGIPHIAHIVDAEKCIMYLVQRRAWYPNANGIRTRSLNTEHAVSLWHSLPAVPIAPEEALDRFDEQASVGNNTIREGRVDRQKGRFLTVPIEMQVIILA